MERNVPLDRQALQISRAGRGPTRVARGAKVNQRQTGNAKARTAKANGPGQAEGDEGSNQDQDDQGQPTAR